MSLQQELWSRAPRRRLTLACDEMHVWRARLDRGPAVVRAMRDTLTPDERERADRFRFEKDRVRFVVARGALRDILGRYLGSPPGAISFSPGEFGKPELAGAAAESRLRFNVSHSDGLALYAVNREREVGVDLELLREDFAGLEIAERFFSPREVQALRALPRESRAAAFFNCWTRKEAYIKARGEGLSHPLHGFTVSLAPGEPAELLATDDDPAEAARWSLVELSPAEGFAAALAVKGPKPPITFWHWSPPPD